MPEFYWDKLPKVYIGDLEFDREQMIAIKRDLERGGVLVIDGQLVVPYRLSPPEVIKTDNVPQARRKSRRPALDQLERDESIFG